MIPGFSVIAESINNSVPSTQQMYDNGDIAGLLELAKAQDVAGAAYIDVNVGPRSADLLAKMIAEIQTVSSKPLSIDSPDYAQAEAGLKTYDPAKANGLKPILNSVSPMRTEMFNLYSIQPFRPILLSSEQLVDGAGAPCHTAEETYNAAKKLVEQFLESCPGSTIDDCIIDPGIAPIGSDMEDNFRRLVDAMKLIQADESLKGVHFSGGLSNFTVMLPSKRPDGMAIKSALESAFLTITIPLGMDMCITSVKRNHAILPEDHLAMKCLNDVLSMSGIDCLKRVKKFYKGKD